VPTVRIDDKRWREIEKKTVEMVIKTKKPIKESTIIKALIDQYLKEISPEDVEKAK
jgi:hypothetical protein